MPRTQHKHATAQHPATQPVLTRARPSRTCECLQEGRQYSNKGRLLDEAHPQQIYECNLNCRCHKDECRNRLVQRGMTCSIKASRYNLVRWDE